MSSETHGIEEILGIFYISPIIRNHVLTGLLISSKKIKKGQIKLKVRWTNDQITNVDLKDFCYLYNGKEITTEYQNSIIATELIEVIKDYNRSCTSQHACLGYIRVSSERELVRDCSVQQQLINLVEFAKSKNLRIHDVLIHNGVSGGPFKKNGDAVHLKRYGMPWNLSRRSFQLFMGNFTITDGNINPACWNCSRIFFEENNIKALYVTSINRLTRMTHGFRLMYEFCRRNNVSICSGLEGNYDNPRLDSRINRNEMFKLALEAELQHMDFCISAQNSVKTKRRKREQNVDVDVDDLSEALDLTNISDRPRQRQRRSRSLSPSPNHSIEASNNTEETQATDDNGFNPLSSIARAFGY
jgi:hypothetical protein